MRTIRINLEKWFEGQDKRWRALPLHKQHSYTLLLFTAYLLLTAGVIFKVWYDTTDAYTYMVIRPIGNPVFKKENLKTKDTPSTFLNDTIYEK
ncbi:nitrogen regulatory IIA protein [Flavobacterium poyangense]|uniref:nitrogen regulatory IIA protein n=1 Tax=Flavobacterium poyangense TaxID=2204302 RepID=UPI0014233A51|nr:nitrogen regulatory IIA protein [Flavobacterium sp. JXAS1]